MADHPIGVTLSRDLGLFDVTMIGVGAMIGAGIFVLTGVAAGNAGPALVLAFFLNGIVASLTAMAYAELGSAFPEAGGGYLWVKEALGGTQGFLGGWMSWFAHAVAGSLYALGFGSFATELYTMAGLPAFGLDNHALKLGFTILIILAFTYLNYRGASETGTVGNIVTITKIIILLLFCAFGLVAMFRHPAGWTTRFTEGFLPNGWSGVLVAMGLTFIAFEGYEIIAQSGEEIKDPKRNLPRATFFSILIVVVIYILVAFVAIAAITPPPGMRTYQLLGEQRETAIIAAAAQVMPFGAIILLISALASTMSALIATTYSSSRVSFAMGRDFNLPKIFSRIHPVRHTPYWAVIISGFLIAVMALTLPLEDVAAAADLMFLFLFIQVNISVMRLRLTRPDLDRGFITPYFPIIPILAIIAMAALAIFLFTFSPLGWFVGVVWIVAGIFLYQGYFSHVERKEKPKEILLEEVLVSRNYSVLVPVATQEQAHILGIIGAVLARQHGGEVFALYVARVPPQLELLEGRAFLKEGRQPLETVITEAREYHVPVHTMIRLGRDVALTIRKTAEENASNIIVLGWPGYTNSSDRVFGSVIDPIVENPPADIAVVRYRQYRTLKSILVPVAGGPNSRRAALMAANMARQSQNGPVKVTALRIIPVGADEAEMIRARQDTLQALDGIPYDFDIKLSESNQVIDAILEVAKGYDLIVIGATNEPLFKNLLIGSIPEQVARRAKVTTIMVKRRSGPIKSMIRETILPPSTGAKFGDKK
ncbi:MAG: amino acid permease [Chloroflexi bacterium]|nr:amino acid permease [Chloroflexota bacterium]